MSPSLQDVESQYAREEMPVFQVGDHVSVAVLIREPAPKGAKNKEDRTRLQNFIGDVIAIGGKGLGRAFTVRRVVQGEGVERVFPFHSPLVKDVKVVRRGDVRRAKLYDLRKKSGKSARIKELTVRKDDKTASKASPPRAAAEPTTESES